MPIEPNLGISARSLAVQYGLRGPCDLIRIRHEDGKAIFRLRTTSGNFLAKERVVSADEAVHGTFHLRRTLDAQIRAQRLGLPIPQILRARSGLPFATAPLGRVSANPMGQTKGWGVVVWLQEEVPGLSNAYKDSSAALLQTARGVARLTAQLQGVLTGIGPWDSYPFNGRAFWVNAPARVLGADPNASWAGLLQRHSRTIGAAELALPPAPHSVLLRHADLHSGNVFTRADSSVCVVDWDSLNTSYSLASVHEHIGELASQGRHGISRYEVARAVSDEWKRLDRQANLASRKATKLEAELMRALESMRQDIRQTSPVPRITDPSELMAEANRVVDLAHQVLAVLPPGQISDDPAQAISTSSISSSLQ